MLKGRWAMIGGGQMAEALVRCWLRAGLLRQGQLIVVDISAPRREIFNAMGLEVSDDPESAIESAEGIVLAIKPQNLASLWEPMKRITHAEQVLISILAGVPTHILESLLDVDAGVIRAMPNTPLRIGWGMTALCGGRNYTQQQLHDATRMFEAGGDVIHIEDERLMDAVTAISGSGPAYVFLLAEKMIEAGRSLGLTAEHATKLTMQTLCGASAMIQESDHDPAELRRQVTSPGGTTQAAIEHMQQQQVDAAITDAVRAAAERSRQLAEQFEA